MTNKPMLSVELLPCPFCGSNPTLPDGYGTQYEIECSGCGQATSSIQICDLMTIDERVADMFNNYRYGEEFIERAKLSAIESWNNRVEPAAEQPAPVADHTQCEECKGWGYHENHHEGGGTECGECGGSGNAPVSVVMPEPYSLAMFQMISGFESVTPEQFDLVWSACRSEVARLNGVKP